jgi:hypothetical protein
MKWLHQIGRWIVSLFVVTTVIFFLAAFVFGDILLLFLPPLVWIVAVNFPFGRTVLHPQPSGYGREESN